MNTPKAPVAKTCEPRFHMDLQALTGDSVVGASKVLDFLICKQPENIEIISVVRMRVEVMGCTLICVSPSLYPSNPPITPSPPAFIPLTHP